VAGFPLSKVTGMFYDRGRLYYTVEGDRKLYYRYFLPDRIPPTTSSGPRSGGQRRSVTGSRLSPRPGMTAAGGHLFWSEGPDLHRVDLAGGVPQRPPPPSWRRG